MKRIVVILLALIMMIFCTSCMEDNGVDSLYEEVEQLNVDIDNIKADNLKLEQENIELEKELKALDAVDLSEKELEMRKKSIDANNQKSRLKSVGLGVLPLDYIHYISNLYYNEKEYEDLYVDNIAYTYDEERTTIYQYSFAYNKKDELVIFLEMEIAKDDLHAEKIKLYYDKDIGDIKDYKLFKKYTKMVALSFIMMKEGTKVVNDDIKKKSDDFYETKTYGDYFAQFGTMGPYETFTISGH